MKLFTLYSGIADTCLQYLIVLVTLLTTSTFVYFKMILTPADAGFIGTHRSLLTGSDALNAQPMARDLSRASFDVPLKDKDEQQSILCIISDILLTVVEGIAC